MITRETIKSEIDKIQDQYLVTLYRIIKALEDIPVSKQDATETKSDENFHTDKNEWSSFIESTYGCLSDDPIERGEQGEFENREAIH
ncbi:hypothetical protein QUF76_06805 [Desulfobacterales bacterium HSG16]|nr:hypothetical protein [Desulfobacterales bacterium HSG16]